MIDSLRLSYTGNRLLKVWDVAEKVTLAESADFKEYANEDTEYFYNANGAMTKDLNKGISDIQYNSLNLPRQMDILSPVAEARNEYVYSASGEKLKVVQKWNPNYSITPVIGSSINTNLLTMNKTTDYAGNLIYENGILKRILIDGGYIENSLYYYYQTDHQGNNRLVYYANGAIKQRNHYYPFGMAFADGLSPSAQPYKYNGKELDQMSGLNQYDYSARYYDPAVGRFTTPDPLAEKYYSISPYVYCNNNPVNIIDPTGMDWYWDKDKTRQYNPDLNKDNQATILGKGQTYIGATDAVMDKDGNVTEDYRADGSIMYSNEASGYSRIWNNSQKTKKEEMRVITDKGVLVLPNYKNGEGGVDWSDYKYTTKNGNAVDANGNEYNTIATVHTHPKGSGPSLIDPEGWGDLGLAANSTPNKPVFVLQNDGKNTISFIQSASANGMLTQGFNQYTVQNITVGMPNFNVKTIQTGGASLRQFTRQYSVYLRTFYNK